MRELLAILAILATAWPVSGNDKSEKIDERRDTPMQLIYFTPHKPKAVGSTGGFLRLDTYKWWIYPRVVQSFDHSKKTMELMVSVTGVTYGYAPLVVTIDGSVNELPGMAWQEYADIFGNNSRVAEVVGRPDLVEKIAQAREVYVTVPLLSERFGAKLSPDQIKSFGVMVAKYESLEGRELSAAGSSSPAQQFYELALKMLSALGRGDQSEASTLDTALIKLLAPDDAGTPAEIRAEAYLARLLLESHSKSSPAISSGCEQALRTQLERQRFDEEPEACTAWTKSPSD